MNMNTIGERLRYVRKRLGLTMTDFGKPLGFSYNVMSNFELGRTEPTDSAIKLICFTYGVNQYFLDTGKGEPFDHPETEDELATQLRIVLSGMDKFKVDTIIRLAKMPDDWWQMLKEQKDG